MKKIAKPAKSLISIEEISAEREIAELQLERLKQISRDRLLSYEECKIYDILTKNLYLAKGEATAINTTSHVVKDVKQEELPELLQIAQTVNENDIKKVLNFVEADTDVGTKETADN